MLATSNPFWLYLPIMIIVAFLGYLIPLLTKKNILFGVKFHSDKFPSNEVLQMMKRFKISFPIFMIFFIIFTGIFLSKTRDMYLGGLLILIQALSTLILYAYFNSKIKSIKSQLHPLASDSESVVTIDTSFRKKDLTISPLWYLLLLVIVMVHFGIIGLYYNSLPAKIPMNYSLAGEVTNYAPKNFFSAFMLPLLSLFFLIIFFIVNFIIKIAKQNIDSSNPKKTAIRNRLFRYKWSKFIYLSGLALIIALFLTSLSQVGIYPLPNLYLFLFTMLVVFGIIISAIYLSIKLGQSGSRIQIDMKTQEEGVSDFDDDKYWKSGLLYYNPNDPAVFVEKRIGIGWTLNFANPISIFISVALIAIIIISIVFGMG